MQSSFHYHLMCAGTHITHLAYADDLLLFARADDSTIALLADYITKFGNTARLHPSLRKSNIYIAALTTEQKTDYYSLSNSSREHSLSITSVSPWLWRS